MDIFKCSLWQKGLMFYKSIHIPIILEVGSDLLPKFNEILKKNFLLFENGC
jgi:hypothetical protein